ncbi:inter-alpha-trypsin inhibitor heavy chain H2 [precursor] [Verrucomicrobiota bacterium]|nr:inter-alpha-trypsin inhibitor heavy chain H2 [precursor] [Verrucomicrobiota bacterium]
MSFLTPLFLIGTLAVALPVLFHLIRRTTKERMPFSSLMFLQASPPRVTRRSRLENLLLLALRCLALCLLGLGFARPFFQTPIDPTRQNEQARKVIVLLDTSASMRREGLWTAALARVEAVLRDVRPEETAAVFAFDRELRPVLQFDDWTRLGAGARVEETLSRLRALSAGWAATRLDQALIGAAEALEDADKNAKLRGPRQIVLVSDLQEGATTEALQGYEWPKGIEVVLEPLKAKRPTNAGMQLLPDLEGAGGAGATEGGTRVRVFNAGESKREQFRVRWAGQPETAATEIYVPPGQSRVVFAPKPADGIAGEQLVLTGDEEDFDNRAFLVPTRIEQVPVLYLGTEAENDTTQPLYFLKRAFQQTLRQIVQVVPRKPADAATLLAATNAPLLIFADAVPDIAALRRFAEAGGMLLAVVKNAAVAETVGQLAGVENFAATEATVKDYAMLGRMDLQHPLFAPFADPRFSDFTKIHFWKHRRLPTDKLPGARVIAEFDSGDPALLQVGIGRGSLLVLACGWHPADSQLALSSKFVPLLYSILEASGGLKAQTAQYLVGDRVELPASALAAAVTGGPTGAGATSISTNASLSTSVSVSVRRPDGTTVTVPAGTNHFTHTELPGNYAVTGGAKPWRFAVNVAATESRTTPMPLEDLERLGVPVKQLLPRAPHAEEAKRRQLASAELENRQKLWRWLIVLALVVLLAESWLAGRTARTPVAAGAN